ncbi:MAG TPA: hypothetical protein VH255_08730 [Verrucomicrobiae bacterium]|jgi:hypothetical protein|nr:hypothetical protein [Verrucomicrobiae bacterium]
MQPREKKIWFPAKRYGWGWGPPVCWQGWLVLFLWFALVVSGAFILAKQIGWFIAFVIVMSGILCLICAVKGEKPGWRWGDK